MALTLRWRGKKFEEKLRKTTSTGLQRATVYLHTECRRAVSTPNSGQRVGGGRGAGGRFKKSRTVYPNPSQPGQPPRLRTGFGARNVVWEYEKETMRGRVGVTRNGLYMFYLDVGTRRIARRPWLVATLRKHSGVIGKLAATGGEG